MITKSQKPHGYSGKSGFSPINHVKKDHLHTAIHRSDIVRVDVQ